MITSAEVSNFRCFEKISLTHLGRVNVIVGDNGSGKTALLEAIFLALGEGPELALRFRQFRGMDGGFAGDRKVIEDAFISDYFHKKDMRKEIKVTLLGTGSDRRTVKIKKLDGNRSGLAPNVVSNPVSFKWMDHNRVEREIIPFINSTGMQLASTGEDRNTARFYAAQSAVGHAEIVGMYSELSRKKRTESFIQVFRKEFGWIEDLSIQVVAGLPAIHATIPNMDETIPVTNVSGAINRMMAIFLALSRADGIVIVDEIDNGVFYKRHVSMCRAILHYCREFQSQIFMSTHSDDWLRALMEAAGDDVSDISLIRLERGSHQPEVIQFSGQTFKAGLAIGGEVR